MRRGSLDGHGDGVGVMIRDRQGRKRLLKCFCAHSAGAYDTVTVPLDGRGDCFVCSFRAETASKRSVR
jgi:hypothetical protein